MLTARSVIIAVVTVAVLSLIGVVINLAQPPGSGGFGADSYGTRAHGHRALYEVLEELRLPLERGLVPPDGLLRQNVCLVFWNPDHDMVQLEPQHLAKVAEWVRAGGKVVVAPPPKLKRQPLLPTPRAVPYAREVSLLGELGLPGLEVTWYDPQPPAAGPAGGALSPAPSRPRKGRAAAPVVQPKTTLGLPQQKEREFCTLPVTGDGSLKDLGGAVSTLQVPKEDLHVLTKDSGPVPAGRVFHAESDGTVRTLAAVYRVGDGEITVVSDPTLFLNDCLARGDNAVLAAHLFHRLGRPLIFDEFYHGLTVRGNPAWLLTKHPYGLLFGMLVLAWFLWAWRAALHLGPPLRDRPAARRTMREYVEAMAGLFYRNGCRTFVLREVRDGTLWLLRKRLGLSPKLETADDLSRILGRKDPQAAARLSAAATEAELVLKGRKPATEMAVVQAARKIGQCL